MREPESRKRIAIREIRSILAMPAQSGAHVRATRCAVAGCGGREERNRTEPTDAIVAALLADMQPAIIGLLVSLGFCGWQSELLPYWTKSLALIF